MVTMVALVGLFAGGCKSKWGTAGLGAAGGAVAAGGGYEYVSNREMKRIEEDYNAGRIDQREYEIRKDQIERMSVLQ
ncbi:MAG: hypothetical protein IH624_03375 [Phycisphaerae bacterium]|nr:hypothetical protein [Phycisphaerae bacterium]